MKHTFRPLATAAFLALMLSACSSTNYAGPKMPKGTALPPPVDAGAGSDAAPTPCTATATEGCPR